MHTKAYFDRLPPRATLAIAVTLTVVIAAVHAAIDARLSFQFVYLAPVSLAAWYTGHRGGLMLAALAAVCWFAAEHFDVPTRDAAWVRGLNVVFRGAALGVVGWTIAAYRRALEHERQVARTDYLTGSLNWRAFAERTESELRRARRYGRPLTFAYIDLDDFKTINDVHGHSEGDRVLTVVAETIRASLRATDVVARLGGDEFAVLLPETGPEPAWVVLRKLHNALRIRFAEEGWPVSASIGAVTCLAAPDAVDTLVGHADRLMYDVKRVGKNRVHHVVVGGQPAVSSPPPDP